MAKTEKTTGARRSYDTGAFRDGDADKIDYEGHLSPAVLRAYCEFLNDKRDLGDGNLRPSDNWQLGMSRDDYMKSGARHFMEWWEIHRRPDGGDALDQKQAVCAVIFNAMGYLHELLRKEGRL